MFLDAARFATEKAVLRPALPMFLLPGWNGTDMAKMTYGEQLKHPNWQRKRLEALEAAEFKCEACLDGETTLHVHHKRYVKGRMAWEYEIGELAVLCEDCHSSAHEADEQFKAVLATLRPDGPNNISDAMALVAGWTRGHGDIPVAAALAGQAPIPAIAGIIARHLCEDVGWKTGGADRLMAFAWALTSPNFLKFFCEVLDDAAQQSEKASNAKKGAGDA
jgi:hypothetical protein